MLGYLRHIIRNHNVCYSRGITVENNTISFRMNTLPGQFPLHKCLTKPFTIISISYPVDLLLINSTTREIQRLSTKIDDDNSLDLNIIKFLRQQGLDNFTYYSPNGSCIIFSGDDLSIKFYNSLDISNYCSTNCNYFILLYLETRLMNLNLTISEINDVIQFTVTTNYFDKYKEKVDSTIQQISESKPKFTPFPEAKHNILNYPPQSKFITNINTSSPKRGLALCHGHRDRPISRVDGYPKDLPQDINWTYMDIHSIKNPDIIGDVTSYESYERAGFSKYDYVYVANCGTGSINEILRGSRMVLKPGGKLIYPNFIGRIKNKITDYIDEYVNELLESEHYSDITTIGITSILTV